MFRTISFQNFKSWKDTGEIALAPITGFFGANSSGKSTILQFFLMLKQTMESSDRQQVLHTGDDRSYVNLGTTYDLSYQHKIPGKISFSLKWDNAQLIVTNSSVENSFTLVRSLMFSSSIQLENENIFVNEFHYEFQLDSGTASIGIEKKSVPENEDAKYELIFNNYEFRHSLRDDHIQTPINTLPPVKNYGFQEMTGVFIQNGKLLYDLMLAYEKVFKAAYYLGPLREYPKRIYSWSGENPQDVGRRGEFAISALLSARKRPQIKQGNKMITIEERIAIWLKDLGLINSFNIQPIAEGRQEYEVKVQRSPNASEVLITDVGFGVSQILPILVLCYYVPEGSTIILEQPEIHLHPSVQAGLADVFIDAMKTRNIQIILESHSEHLLRRLQRRIAEEKDGLKDQDVKLYFCNSSPNGSSNLTPLQIDPFGNIANWPENFFGDEMGDLFAMTEAAMKRQMVKD
jgi:predicted ATPase